MHINKDHYFITDGIRKQKEALTRPPSIPFFRNLKAAAAGGRAPLPRVIREPISRAQNLNSNMSHCSKPSVVPTTDLAIYANNYMRAC